MTDSKRDYSYDELLFARKMREVANRIRQQRAPSLRGRDDDDTAEFEQSTSERNAWLDDHPLEDFIEEIVIKSMETADAVRDIIHKKKA